MEEKTVLAALSALGHEQRLDIFRYLVRAGGDGTYAGEIADALGARANTLSANLTILAQAGLVVSTREGRHIRYRAEMSAMQGLVAYLLEDCCGGNPALCAPVFDQLKVCC